MTKQITATFIITVKEQAEGYTIEAVGPQGIQFEPQPFPARAALLSAEEEAFIANELDPSEEIQALGQSLYQAMFIAPNLANDFYRAQGMAEARQGKLRLRLEIEPPELASLPWEAMHDGQEWLMRRNIVLVRRIKPAEKTEPLAVSGALHILFVGATPLDQKGGRIDIETMLQSFQVSALLQKAIADKRVVFDFLLHATKEDLRNQLAQGYHCLYFAAHGSPQGLYLDDGYGKVAEVEGRLTRGPSEGSVLISAEELVELLQEKEQPTRLIFLAACNTATLPDETEETPAQSQDLLLQSFAEKLVQGADLPAIVAMQFPVSDQQANELTASFFASLAAFDPVDIALAEAREGLLADSGIGRDVINPVMYLQVEDGALFRKAVNWWKWSAVGVAVALVVAVVIGMVAWFESQADVRAEATAKAVAIEIGRSRALAVEAQKQLDNDRLDLALLLSKEALTTANTGEAQSILLATLEHNPRLTTFLWGHELVVSLAFSPNGKILASGGSGGEYKDVMMWDVDTYERVELPLIAYEDVSSVAFSPNGKILASGGWNGDIILWDVDTYQAIGSPLTGHRDLITSLTFNPAGNILISSSWDDSIILWDVDTRQPVAPPLTPTAGGSILSVAISPDGKILASGDMDGSIILWDLDAHLPLDPPLTGHTDSVENMAFSPDGKTLASIGCTNANCNEAELYFWDVANGRPLSSPYIGNLGEVLRLAFNSDGRILASSGPDNTIVLWDVASRQSLDSPLTGHQEAVTSLAFNPNGQTLASGSLNEVERDLKDGIILWDVATERRLGSSLNGHQSAVTSLTFSSDSRTLVSGSCGKEGCQEGEIRFWDVASRQPLSLPLPGHGHQVGSLVFSLNDKMLTSASLDGTIILWDVDTYEPIESSLISDHGVLYGLALSPDSKIFAAGGQDNSIFLWDIDTGQPLDPPLTGLNSFVIHLAFNPTGQILASTGCAKGGVSRTCAKGEIWLWDMVKHQPLGPPLIGHEDFPYSVAFNPDSKILASGGGDSTIILWDLTTQQPLGPPLTKHQSSVQAVAFSPDGATLASGSENGTIILWDVTTRRAIGPLPGPKDQVRSLVFSPDNKILASGYDDGTIILWDVDRNSWMERACRIANRDLTQAEWEQFIGPDFAYTPICSTLLTPAEE